MSGSSRPEERMSALCLRASLHDHDHYGTRDGREVCEAGDGFSGERKVR